ncbi:MinD/ParA family protein [Desulfovibrio ferrophilus]|uniref:Cobyrinic acid ac-diamide synthase n=1 Tax=Desulfovibrio ferrophilus TaxID=241368 RepID=A0A2Z6B3H3_9BACT|nr:MinD/ParA family protein [Desulfovibrio ferrophilus]BBD10057.1 cobyrinic acid ac-diamide synthase [Desulfovibrio ferrophilus]
MKIVPLNPDVPPTRVVSVASGKGGVGKTSVTVNLAFALADLGNKVCILDADLGLSNVDILLGVEPLKTLEDVLFDGVSMAEAILPVGKGVDLVSGASGVPRLAELSLVDRRRLVEQFQMLDTYDYLLVDNSPGITQQILSICLSSKDIIVVVTPDATSITDAYALIKVMTQNGLWWSPQILINRAKNPRHARLIYEKIRSTAGKRLGLSCAYLGCILEDRAMSAAGLAQRPLMQVSPGSAAAQDIASVAKSLDDKGLDRKGRDISPVRFLDGSIMRLKQQDRSRKSVTATAKRFARRNATLDATALLGGLDHLSLCLDRLDLPHSEDEQQQLLASMRRELGSLRALLAPTGGATPTKPVRRTSPIRQFDGNIPAPRTTGNGKALLICPPSPMRDVLTEVLSASGLVPVATHPRTTDEPDFSGYSLGLVCWDAPKHELEHLVSRAAGTPVVLLRGYRRAPEQEPSLADAPVTVLHKPFKVTDLTGAIRKAAGLS